MPKLIPGSQELGIGFSIFDGPTAPPKKSFCNTTSLDVPIDATYSRANSVDYDTVDPRGESVVDSYLSREEYQEKKSQEVSAKGQYGAFSASFEATFGSGFQSFKESCAAVSTYEVSLWKLKLTDTAPILAEVLTKVRSLPASFNEATASAFYNLFDELGTHVVVEVFLGGTLEYAMLVDRSSSKSRTEIKARVSAEYGAFFSGSATASQVEEVKRFAEHRRSKLTVAGGEPRHIQLLNHDEPTDLSRQFHQWSESIPTAPAVVGKKIVRIDEFLRSRGCEVAAITRALDTYLGAQLRIQSTWSKSVFAIGGEVVATKAAPGAAQSPALRIVLIDKVTLAYQSAEHVAPSPEASNQEVEAFWQRFGDSLGRAPLDRSILVIATERWPRDPRYSPPKTTQELLEHSGVRHATLERWNQLTRQIEKCPVAGISFVSVSCRLDSAFDAISAGFAKKDADPQPEALVEVLLVRKSEGRIHLILDQHTEASHSSLYTFQCAQESQLFLAADPNDRHRLKGKSKDAVDPGQLWYLYPASERYGLHPYVLINFATCGLIRGDYKEGESVLGTANYGDFQDDVLWDLRTNAEGQRHFLMLHYNHEWHCLCLVNDRIAVRRWGHSGVNWYQTEIEA